MRRHSNYTAESSLSSIVNRILDLFGGIRADERAVWSPIGSFRMLTENLTRGLVTL